MFLFSLGFEKTYVQKGVHPESNVQSEYQSPLWLVRKKARQHVNLPKGGLVEEIWQRQYDGHMRVCRTMWQNVTKVFLEQRNWLTEHLWPAKSVANADGLTTFTWIVFPTSRSVASIYVRPSNLKTMVDINGLYFKLRVYFLLNFPRHLRVEL